MRKASSVLLALACASATVHTADTQTVVREVYLMGTRARLTTSAPDRMTGLATLERALGVLEATENELSTWRAESVVSRLNRHPIGEGFLVPRELCDTFAVISEWHAATAGTFDPAIGRLTDAWGIHAGGRVPTEPALRAARASSGLRLLAFDSTRCEITRRGDVALDVGAFGKGDALDRVERALGDLPWMIDLGGQISVHGAPDDDTSWKVAIAHPVERHRAFLKIALVEGSLSTSGGSERDLTVNGRRIAHHLDPRTGKPTSFDGSVTVWHRRGLVADILSTALYVMGPIEGVEFAEGRGIAACYLVPQADGQIRVIATTAFRQLFL
jgi:thiamine biosynthesis lipoprotein